MKKWMQFYLEREGLGELGNQDLSDDHEDNEELTHGDPDISELSIVRKAIKIAWEAGDPVRMKVVNFLKRLSRDIPQLHNLVSQLTDEEDNRDDNSRNTPPNERKDGRPIVTTPAADSSPQPGTGGGEG